MAFSIGQFNTGHCPSKRSAYPHHRGGSVTRVTIAAYLKASKVPSAFCLPLTPSLCYGSTSRAHNNLSHCRRPRYTRPQTPIT